MINQDLRESNCFFVGIHAIHNNSERALWLSQHDGQLQYDHTVEIYFSPSKSIEATCIFVDRKSNLVVLSTKKECGPISEPVVFSCSIHSTMDVFVVGFSDQQLTIRGEPEDPLVIKSWIDEQFVDHECILESSSSRDLQLHRFYSIVNDTEYNKNRTGGMHINISGCPVIDHQGNIVGMTSSVDDYEDVVLCATYLMDALYHCKRGVSSK
ncbi:unnamed protein product [Didymodactylos carnosus]|uniref:Uncharacterized protein n=1 Tax=Didymodactylos carnosus TaxID=1234261 RepID=A0A8S2I574_9BILA|nr:unnamed protein product [Didymodactylos carnosus]CAF3719167.1 unnamed protein product [Didymodactylos carnosus]